MRRRKSIAAPVGTVESSDVFCSVTFLLLCHTLSRLNSAVGSRNMLPAVSEDSVAFLSCGLAGASSARVTSVAGLPWPVSFHTLGVSVHLGRR